VTQERFFRLIEDPSLLANISYEEMKTLALAYPYAHNLRYLLALKAFRTHHPETDKALATAAAYSLDGMQLFQLIAPKEIVPQPVLEKEEVLELKPVETLRQELEALSPLPRSAQQSSGAQQQAAEPPKAPEPSPDQAQPEQADEAPAPLPPEPLAQQAPAPPYQPFEQWFGQFQPPLLEARPRRRQPTAPKPEAPAEPAPPKKMSAATLPPEKGIAQVLAERSVSENKDVISETLAKLLAKQGHRERAISMYERLRLAFPEKSAYFAAEIEKLKN
jgi:hypothetical protein